MDNHAPLSQERQRLLALRLKGSAKLAPEPARSTGRDADEHPPLSVGEHQMWLLDRLHPGNPAYNVPVAYRISGELDVRALQESFNGIIKRHEAWRTTYLESGTEPRRVIHAECQIWIEETDLSPLPAEQREGKLHDLVAGEAARPFDLGRLPLLRVSHFKLGGNEHVLLINAHHIVADGLSLSLMFDELDAHYRAALSGTVPTLPRLAAKYADFAAWQRNDLAAPRHSRQVDYWKRQLGGDLPVLEITTDRPRPLRQSFAGSTLGFSIASPLAQALATIGTRERCTFFVTVLTAFQILLTRYSNAFDLIIGTPVASRPLPEFERLIGNFLNVVALRCDVSGNPSFLELLQRSRATALDALSNKDVPFEIVVKSLKSQRDPSRNPVFQALLQILPPIQSRLGDLAVAPFDFELRFAQFDIALSIYEQPDGESCGYFQYCTDLFDRRTIENLSRNFTCLLTEIARDPHQRVLEIPTIAEPERSRLLVEWNDNKAEYPQHSTIQELFENQARRTPDSVAVESGREQLTYRELDCRANQLANRLRALGVGPNVRVGISVSRDPNLVIGLLGILKAGGAYVPIDPEYPVERRALMLQDAAAPVLVTGRKLTDGFPARDAKVICLDTDWAAILKEDDRAPESGATAGDLAYVIFTSGSTGQPKGVEIEHRGVCNMIAWQIRFFQISATSRVLQFASFSFDASVSEVLTALTTGATLVMASRELSISPHDLAAFLREARVTHATFPPTLLAMLPHGDLPALRTLVSAGEACPREVIRQWGNGRRFINAYGPTEASVCASAYICDGTGSGSPPIGRPIQNTQFFILNPHLQPAPAGVPGELHIGGVGLARGYLNRPELTREKFIPNPFSTDAASRLYKTGDLCRYLPDGNVEYLGRIDHQVKIRGFRVEPGEIASVLKQHPGVRDAVVIVREDSPGDRRLVAYLVSAQTPPCPASDLRSHLKARVPDYMIPAGFVFLDAIPVGANGKVDRKALPAPEFSRSDLPGTYAAPQTELEQKISVLWSDILKVDRVGLHDNFFELGGDSLAAMQVISRLRGAQFPDLHVLQIFERPTVAAFVKILPVAGTGEEREEGVL